MGQNAKSSFSRRYILEIKQYHYARRNTHPAPTTAQHSTLHSQDSNLVVVHHCHCYHTGISLSGEVRSGSDNRVSTTLTTSQDGDAERSVVRFSGIEPAALGLAHERPSRSRGHTFNTTRWADAIPAEGEPSTQRGVWALLIPRRLLLSSAGYASADRRR